MSLRINTNMSALNALRNVERASDGFGRSIEKLASGLRINRSADDPAGLIRSEDLRAQITGLEQAIANSQDATNLVKTAEGALEEVHNLLRSMRQLAVASGNTGTNDLTALQANQNQINSAIDSINRIAAQTQFGTKKLLDGTAGVSAVVTDFTRVGGMFFGGSVFGSVSGAASQEYAIGTGTITIDVTTAATRASITGNRGYTPATAIIQTSASVVINGVSFSTQAGTTTIQSFVDQINSQSSVTGVVAELVDNGTNLNVRLRAKEYGANFSVTVNDQQAILFNAATTSSASGTNAAATVSVTNIDGGVVTVLFTGGKAGGDSGLKLTDAKGNVILLNEAGNDTATGDGAVGRTSAGQLEFQIGANAGQVARFSINNMRADKIGTGVVAGKSLKDIDVTKTGGAEEALKVIDAAISQVSKLRGDMGAFQRNVLESNMRSLSVAKENLTATESAIRDTNFAEEISRFTKFQILQQAGMSVLGQANFAPQGVLQLIR
ncbi:MAG: flagellin [Fimbriimonadales bacterium]|nr:MAG: flagellin [Fimbriimonadales bacterium]GIV10764.1 MAG: flagellin [Fimbriimonadales bacterium]